MGAVPTGIARVEADHQFSLLGGGNHGGNDLFQGHGRAIHDFAALFGIVQQVRIDQGPGVDNEIRLLQQFLATDRDQISRARAGTNKINHYLSNSFSLTRITEK